MTKEDRLHLLVLIVIIGFFIAVVYHYSMGYYFGRPYPANTFLFRPWSRFSDFTLILRQSATLDPFGEDIGGFAGAPFGHLLGYLFSVIKPASLRLPILLSSFFVAFALMAKHCLYGLKSRLASSHTLIIFVVVFLTYPVLFAVDRANFDLLVLPLLFLFAFTYGKRQNKASVPCLGVAIALKPYAAIFILIYVLDKRYRDSLLVLFTTLFLSVLSLSLFKDGVFVETQKYLHALSHLIGDPSSGSQLIYTSDLFSLLRVVARPIGDVLHWGSLADLADHTDYKVAYAIVVVLVSAYFAIYLWQKPKPLWKTMAVLTILIILFPFTTHDYRLILLFVPMLMRLATNETTRNDLLIVVLWGLSLVPKAYYHFQYEQNIGMVINPLLLIGLLICIIPGAFSIRGVTSSVRFLCTKLRLASHGRVVENSRSN